jgi:hypothetical protein
MRKLHQNTTTQQATGSTQSKALTAIQYHQMTLIQKATYGVSFGGPTSLILEVLGTGGAGIAVGILVGLGTGYFSEEVKSGLIDKLPKRRERVTDRRRKLHWWLTGEDTRAPEQQIVEGSTQTSQTGVEQPQTEQSNTPALSEIDLLFQAQKKREDTPPIPRLKPNDIIRNTDTDEYFICIGRSLTKAGNPPVWINFYCQHLKIIGASQYGKSSMAACILYLITRTHAPENVRIALLDLENKTSKLFLDCQHIAKICIDGQWIKLHAKSYEEVLEHLGYCVDLMNERYQLTEEQVEQEPLLVVYIEEFLDLKDYYKRLVDSLTGSAKEEAKKNYSQLVFRVSQLARRALKVKIQLLLCAQVDYRDEDFAESLANITGGMSFNVKSTAAQAAGFVRTDLLKRNEKEDRPGQAVVETRDAKDLVLAPEYNLKAKLLALSKSRQAVPLPNGKETTIIQTANTLKLPEEELIVQMPEATEEEPEQQGETIILGKDQVTGRTVSLTKEQFEIAINLRDCGMSTGYRDLMKPFSLSEHHAKVLNQKIRTALGEKPIDITAARARE